MEADLLRERRADTPNEDAGNPARTSCRDDCRGVVAREFALLASFLFLLLFSLIDLGLLFYDSVNLHNAERAVARRLRIMAGQGAQAQQAAIDSTLCNNLVLIDCSKVQIDVRSFDSLAEITDTVAIDGNGDMVNPRIDRVSSDQLVFVTMIAIPVFGEELEPNVAIGAAMVIGAGVVAVWRERRAALRRAARDAQATRAG